MDFDKEIEEEFDYSFYDYNYYEYLKALHEAEHTSVDEKHEYTNNESK